MFGLLLSPSFLEKTSFIFLFLLLKEVFPTSLVVTKSNLEGSTEIPGGKKNFFCVYLTVRTHFV